MSRVINKVILIGNLGAEPEVRYSSTEVAVANIRVATSEGWKDKQGQMRIPLKMITLSGSGDHF